jgi:alpha-D-xyloside xylohydrolase
MMPYLYRQAALAREFGTPMLRAMMLEFPDDPACDYLDRQYMLGDSVMVAPVFSEAGDVQFYLPEGRWTHLWHNDEIQGSRWHKQQHDFRACRSTCATTPAGAGQQQPEAGLRVERGHGLPAV